MNYLCIQWMTASYYSACFGLQEFSSCFWWLSPGWHWFRQGPVKQVNKHTWSLFVLGVFVCFLFYCHCILHFSIIDKVNILVYMYFRSVSIGCFCGQSALCLLNSYINKAFSQQKTSSHWILFSFFNHSLLNSRDDSLGQSQ